MSKLEIPPLLANPNPLGFWDLAMEVLAKELSPQQFKTWIQPLKIKGYDESERLLLIGAPNPFKLDWIKRTFSARLQEIAVSYFGNPINLQFTLGADPSKTSAGAPALGFHPEKLIGEPVDLNLTAGPAFEEGGPNAELGVSPG